MTHVTIILQCVTYSKTNARQASRDKTQCTRSEPLQIVMVHGYARIVARTRTRTRTRVRIRVSDTPRKMIDTGVVMKSRFEGLHGMLTSQAFQNGIFASFGIN
jgi:hypothetical protein